MTREREQGDLPPWILHRLETVLCDSFCTFSVNRLEQYCQVVLKVIVDQPLVVKGTGRLQYVVSLAR